MSSYLPSPTSASSQPPTLIQGMPTSYTPGWMKWKLPLGVRRFVGRRNAREQTRVQGAVVLREPGSPLPHESDDESGLRESQHPAPSHTAV